MTIVLIVVDGLPTAYNVTRYKNGEMTNQRFLTKVQYNQDLSPDLFNPDRERDLLALMVERGPLVDGRSGKPEVTVDGLPWEKYAAVFKKLEQLSKV